MTKLYKDYINITNVFDSYERFVSIYIYVYIWLNSIPVKMKITKYRTKQFKEGILK